ncbi:MAG: Uma2 family endonuclease [Verrucomicrobia bacterium]|nr:Uma2 family endonuclease [Verrucomicrobiota bacterium]
MPLTIHLRPSVQQTAFNLKRWAELLADPELARLPHRIETDRHGRILMSPPPAPKHGNFQSEIAHILRSALSAGRVVTECPLSTSDGVKAIDFAWLAPGRAQELRSMTCLVRAPEVCVEVLSAANTSAEIAEKIDLYFEAGAKEVWTCDQDGTMEFHFPTPPGIRPVSAICSGFPSAIEFAGE